MGNYVSIHLFMDMHYSLIIFDFSVSIKNFGRFYVFLWGLECIFSLMILLYFAVKKKSSENVRQCFAVYIDPTYRAYHSQMMLLK